MTPSSSNDSSGDALAARLFAGPGEARALARSIDWATTSLGAVEGWPQSLRTAVDVCLGTPFAQAVLWGPELIYVYNEGAIALLGTQFPVAMGRPARKVVGDFWTIAAPRIAKVLATGEAFRAPDALLTIDHGGGRRQAYFTLSFSALRDESGRVAGVMALGVDVTQRVLAEDARARSEAALRQSEARRGALLALSDAIRPLGDAEAVKAASSRVLGERLRANRVFFAEVEDNAWVVDGRFERGVTPVPPGRYASEIYGPGYMDAFRAGRPVVYRDVRHDPAFGPAERDAHLALEIAAAVGVPLVNEGRLVAVLVAQSANARDWTEDEIGIVEEISERTWAAVERARATAELRASEARNRLIIESARDYAILTTDPEGLIESWSPGSEAIFGWTAAEAAGRPIAMTFTPEDRAAGAPEEERAVAAEGGVAPDVRWHQRRDGGRVFIEGSTRALRDDAGALRGFLKVGQDVTRRRELDDALHASEVRFRTLVENVRDYAIFGLDANGLVRTWTPGAERVKGYTEAEVLGRPLAMFYTPEDVAAGEVAGELAEAAVTGRVEREGWRVRKGGERIWVNEIATAVYDAAGALRGFTKISRDLTAQRRVEEEREWLLAREQAARGGRARGAHERRLSRDREP